jgi:hypothetical protein
MLSNNDKKLFTDTMYMGEGDESAMRDALFDSMRASMALGQDIEKTYGKQEGSAVPTAEEMAKLEITEEGDHANAVGGAPLIKKDGKWMVDMSQQIPPGPNKDIAIKAMHASAAAFDKVRQDVGKPDFTAEKIKQELRTELQSAMMKIQMEAAPQMQAAQSQSASQPAAAPVAEPK